MSLTHNPRYPQSRQTKYVIEYFAPAFLERIQSGTSKRESKNLPATNLVPLQLGQVNLRDNVSINVLCLTSEVRRQPLEAVHRRSPDRETACGQNTARRSGCCLHRLVMRNPADTPVLETLISHSFTQSQPIPENKPKAHTTERPALDKPMATLSKTTARNLHSHIRRDDTSNAAELQRQRQTLTHNVKSLGTANPRRGTPECSRTNCRASWRLPAAGG